MAFNSYKEDEQTSHVKKSATLLRLFSYLLAYKKKLSAYFSLWRFVLEYLC